MQPTGWPSRNGTVMAPMLALAWLACAPEGRDPMWALDAVFGLDSKQIAMAIDMLLRHANLTIQDSEVVAAALSHFRSRPKVGFSDCLILEVAKKAGHIPVGTFDREMAKLEGALRV